MDSYLLAFKKELSYKSKEGKHPHYGFKIKDKITAGEVQ